MGKGVVHVIMTHLIQRGIPDGVLFREQVCKKLEEEEEEESSENETEMYKLL